MRIPKLPGFFIANSWSNTLTGVPYALQKDVIRDGGTSVRIVFGFCCEKVVRSTRIS